MAGSAPLFPRPRSRRPRPPSPFPYTTLFRSYRGDIATIPANLAGVPGMSLPSGLAEDGLPAGFQVLAPAMADDRLYTVGAALEQRLVSAWGGHLLEQVPEPAMGA